MTKTIQVITTTGQLLVEGHEFHDLALGQIGGGLIDDELPVADGGLERLHDSHTVILLGLGR